MIFPQLGRRADSFYGPVPVTERLSKTQVDKDYELNTGITIVETFKKRGIDPTMVPAILANDHEPFAWGNNAFEAVHNGVILDVAYYAERLMYHSIC